MAHHALHLPHCGPKSADVSDPTATPNRPLAVSLRVFLEQHKTDELQLPLWHSGCGVTSTVELVHTWLEMGVCTCRPAHTRLELHMQGD